MNSLHRLAAAAVIGVVMNPGAAWANGQSGLEPDPVGTWLTTVTFGPGGPPPFKEILTFHAGGTITETNTTLDAASGFLPQPVFNLVGSDGQGTWERLPGGKIGLTVTKLVFCGPAASILPIPGQQLPAVLCGSTDFGSGAPAGAHIGYLQFKAVATVKRNTLDIEPADSTTMLYLGEDIESAVVIPFGGAGAAGKRLR